MISIIFWWCEGYLFIIVLFWIFVLVLCLLYWLFVIVCYVILVCLIMLKLWVVNLIFLNVGLCLLCKNCWIVFCVRIGMGVILIFVYLVFVWFFLFIFIILYYYVLNFFCVEFWLFGLWEKWLLGIMFLINCVMWVLLFYISNWIFILCCVFLSNNFLIESEFWFDVLCLKYIDGWNF